MRRSTAALAASSLVAAGYVAAMPQPAGAHCEGSNQPVTRVLVSSDGVVRAEEDPDNGTCDGDDSYYFWLRDRAADGYNVQIQMQDEVNGSPVFVQIATGSSAYRILDGGGNGAHQTKLCRLTSGVPFSCGPWKDSYKF